APHFCSACVVCAVCRDGSRVELDCDRRSTSRRPDHVDSRRNGADSGRAGAAGEMGERVAAAMGVLPDGRTDSRSCRRAAMKWRCLVLTLLAGVGLLTGCEQDKRAKEAAMMTGGGNANA